MGNKVNRAAQFMPFDALKGLQEALRKREEIHSRIAKKDVDEESQDAISQTLTRLNKGDLVSVDFYFNGHYINIVGKVVEKETIKKYIVVEQAKIDFTDLYRISILEKE